MDKEAIGYLPPERLEDIPKNYQSRHEFLIFLYSRLEDLIVDTQQRADRTIRFYTNDIPEFDAEEFKKDPIGYACKHNVPGAKEGIINDVSLALMADFAKFIHAALLAFEKRSFAVGYANLRKPLKENLLLLTWICADDNEFYENFLSDPTTGLNNIRQEKRAELYEKARMIGISASSFPENVVEKLIWDRQFEHSLAPYFDKSLHLVTSFSGMKTEEMNLNFIFKDPRDNDVYEVGYLTISLVLLYAFNIFLVVCKRIYSRQSKYQTWLEFILWVSYEVIFLDAYPEMFKKFTSAMEETLRCVNCAEKLSFSKAEIPAFLMIEKITCSSCGATQHFPLFWLFCHERRMQEATQQET